MGKRILAIVFAILLMAGAFAEQELTQVEWPEVDYAVPEKPFVNSMLKLGMKYAEYEGKTVSLIGYVDSFAEGEPFFVGRDYNCCGTDTTPYGFLCIYDGEVPDDDTWVEVVGTLTKVEDAKGLPALALEVIAIRPAEEGARVVDY